MTISAIVAVVVLSILAYLLLRAKGKKANRRVVDSDAPREAVNDRPTLQIDLVRSKWSDIIAMQSAGPSGIKNALMEADKLLDYVMRAKGFRGETMADRLRSGGQNLGNLNAVWTAHKLRNQLAHEVEHDLVPQQIQGAILTYKQAIIDLGVPL